MSERDDQGDREQGEQLSKRETEPQQIPSETGETQAADEHDPSTMPDLSAIRADDALLDGLGSPEQEGAEDADNQELNALLLAWKGDIEREPFPELVDTSTALTTIRTAKLAHTKGKRPHRRFFVPIATAAAVLAIGFTGTALGARDAEPGDALWGVSKVLYSDYTRSIEAAASVRTELNDARTAIGEHRYDDARESLHQAEQSLGQVTGEEDHSQLRERHTELQGRLGAPEDPDTQAPDSTETRSPSRSSEAPSSSTSPTSSSQESSSSSSESSSSPTEGTSDPAEPTDSSESTTSESESATSTEEPRSGEETS